jgi:hypothetical protein
MPMTGNSSNKGGEALGVLFVIGLIVWGVTAFLGGEREGEVKYNDCREIIRLPSDTWEVLYKKFTCSYSKTISGHMISGECVHIDKPWSLFGGSDACDTAYVYQKKQDDVCPKDYPYLQYNDKCSQSP